MKILLTGGAGFIGSALALACCDDPGTELIVVDKLSYSGVLASLAPLRERTNFTFECADICDAESMARIFQQHQPDAVAHLAAETHVDRSISSSAPFVQTNLLGTFVLLETVRTYFNKLSPRAKGGFRFLHVSTDEVYGSLDEQDPPCGEHSSYDPRSPYSATKAGSDHLARAWHHTYGLPVIITHCTNNYGPRQFPEKLIPSIILNGIEGLALELYGDGAHRRDWLYVDDHVQALIAILKSGKVGETYNIGARCERSNIEVLELLCGLLDRLAPGPIPRRHKIVHVTDRLGHDRRYATNPSKLEQELGWHPRCSFEAGLDITVRWYLNNPDWWRPLRARARAAGAGSIPMS